MNDIKYVVARISPNLFPLYWCVDMYGADTGWTGNLFTARLFDTFDLAMKYASYKIYQSVKNPVIVNHIIEDYDLNITIRKVEIRMKPEVIDIGQP